MSQSIETISVEIRKGFREFLNFRDFNRMINMNRVRNQIDNDIVKYMQINSFMNK